MLFAACTGAAPSPDPAVAEVDLGWATTVVRVPAAFTTLMDQTDRDGWIAVFEHRYLDAADTFASDSGVAGGALYREVVLQQDLQRTTTFASRALFSAWEQRGALPAGNGPRLAAALAEKCLEKQPTPWDAQLSSDVGTWLGAFPTWPAPSGLNPSLAAAAASHRAADRLPGGRALASWAAADGVLWTDPPDAEGVSRQWADPCVHGSLAQAFGAQMHPKATPPSELGESLFGPADDTVLATLGLNEPVTDDDAQAAREEIRVADQRLDAVREHLQATADDDGRALLEQLDPVHRLRQETLVQRARADLRAGRVERALATLMLARDVTDRSVGPRNSPALLALLTEANLRSGRPRQALDALQPLVAARPEVAPLREILSDLVVLRGLDRRGDSKEH